MRTTTFFERVSGLPEMARQELFDFLKFLEWKYAEEIQSMSTGEFEEFIADRASDAEQESLLIDGDQAIAELRKAVKSRQSQR